MKPDWVFLPGGRRMTREAYEAAIAELRKLWEIKK